MGPSPRRLLLVLVLALLAAGLPGVIPRPAAAANSGPVLPLRIDLRMSLRAQFGYTPDYELNVPSFDPWNRPYIRSRTVSQHKTGHMHTLDGTGWSQLALVEAVRRDYPTFAATVNAGGYVSELVEFDALCRAYTLLEIRLANGALKNVLLYSMDGCVTWRTVTLPIDGHVALYSGRDIGTMTMEHFTGWDLSNEPPLIALWRPVARWPGLRASRNELYVVRPTFEGDQLVLPPPTLVTNRHLGMTQAAGGASFAATSGSTSFIVWTDVAPARASGAPTYVAALDRRTGQLTTPVLVGRAHPPNDDHDTPGICLDGHGYLHVVIGAHSHPFRYVHSVRPLDASAWTAPRVVLSSGFRERGTDADGRGRQTYVSLVCLPDDTLVLVFRQHRAGVDRVFAGRSYCALSMQTRPSGGKWSPARRLVYRRDRDSYAIYYQKLAVDRSGRLFLSLNCCDPRVYRTALRERHRYHRRMVLVSGDAGASWRFATLQDYRACIEPTGATPVE
ncbi:MAG: BNR-4 repeat-containing protein, partial [Thermoleophilia bacterium]|nr:BNR-4 repeat-containing protein [Thermoleophilia bacterium]